MFDRPSADIIPFPRTPPDRLRNAMANLETALAAQRDAIAGWRASVEALRDSVTGLHGSLSFCPGTSDGVGIDLAKLVREASHTDGAPVKEAR